MTPLPERSTTEHTLAVSGSPRLVFATELHGLALRSLLMDDGLMDTLSQHGYGIAMGMIDLSPERAEVVRRLNEYGVYVVAWLLLPPDEGCWFNLQNYPQAVERYQAFHAWAHRHMLRFDAVGLDIEPPSNEIVHLQHWEVRELARRLWLASENVLYTAARAAYTDLIAEIHHDGYEVHTYQLPLLADDRRAGTTLLQRALDVVDLPSDVEVLMCYSSFPIDRLKNDLQGALITSYGPDADSIGVGSTGGTPMHECASEQLSPLSWDALKRDLLLAARYTDTIYVFSLEGCVEQRFIPHIATLNWDSEPPTFIGRRVLVALFRLVVLVVLLFARSYRALFLWLGWGLALLLFLRQVRRCRRQTDNSGDNQ